MNPTPAPGAARPPLAAPSEIRAAIEVAVAAVWPCDNDPPASSGWATGTRRTWRFGNRWWASPVQLRRERPG
ncbi:MAG TPA: hypothetical protein VED84_05495 [Acidimicrobiales bacterium]|nr:hypothetical protein [Acidimicrobiales bacterium]